ncbi:hypothetical protein Pcinc_002312 [Petrolisthes cinctipes]|uniref:Uncharacterized protein n=1 Tax=Petrolisthes cinctipes TaxID=88211 RepID=A0AAE1GL55_PETCI|nr:hypothetical protein Pcinc_002312 [Petrolisthes cinctipes]
MRGADGWTDHRLVRSILQLRIRPPIRRQAPRPCLNIKALSDQEKRAALQAELLANLAPPAPNDNPATTDTLSVRWRTVSEVLLNTARSVLGTIKRKNRDWFDEQAEDIHQLLEEKKRAHQSVLANPNARTRENLAELRSRVQRETRKMQNEWWTKLAAAAENRQEWHSLCRTGTEQLTTHWRRKDDNGVMRHSKREVISRALLVDAYASQGLDSSATSESIECNRTEPDSSVFFSMVQSHRRLRRTTLSK